MRLLVRREHGAHELASKLQQKGFIAEDVQEAIAECQRLGLQSDLRFVDNVSRARIRQGYGPTRIRQELLTLHIERELIEDRLQQEQDSWLSYALAAWEKKFKEHEQHSFAMQQKQKQFLLYRGFTTDTIAQVFKELRVIMV